MEAFGLTSQLTSSSPPPWLTNPDDSTAHAAASLVLPTVTITPTASPDSNRVPIGAIVGGAVGGFAVLVAAILLVLFWVWKMRRKAAESLAQGEIPSMSRACPSKVSNT